MDNRELVNKAVVATDAIAAAGKLNPVQAAKFLDLVVDVTGLKDKVRIERFRADQYDIDKMGVGKRVAMRKDEASAPSRRRGITTSKVKLNPENIVVPFEISADFMLENIEGEAVEDTIIRMMATQTGNDVEDLGINGNKLGPAILESDLFDGGSTTQYVVDNYLNLQDGWLTLANSAHVVDAGGANIGANVFSKMIKEMPDKWKKVRPNMKFFVSTDHDQNYRNTVSGRATGLGDQVLQDSANQKAYGIEIVPLSILETNPLVVEHITGLTGTTPKALKSKNLIEAVAHLTTLGGAPTAALAGSDLVIDLVNGTVARGGSSTLTDPVDVKVTYRAPGQAMLSEYRNMILGLGRDVTILKDSDIYKHTNQYAIHMKVGFNVEESDALVWAKNLGND